MTNVFKTPSIIIKKLSVLMILTLIINSASIAQSPSSQIKIVNSKGAVMAVKDFNFQESNFIIPAQTTLAVLEVKRESTQSDEDDEVVWFYYKVKYQNKVGWIKASDTNLIKP